VLWSHVLYMAIVMVADDSDSTDYPVWGTDRPRGILSPADRKFLAMSPEERAENYSRAAKGQRERAIRERTRNGIIDFCLLWSGLTDRDRRLLFNPHEIDNETELRAGVQSAISLFYTETCKPKYGHQSEDTIVPFGRLIESAIQDAEAVWRDVDPDDFFEEIVLRVSVMFSVIVPEPVNPEPIVSKIYRRALHELTGEEARYYLFVQMRSGSGVGTGEEAAQEFIQNIEQLVEDGALSEDTEREIDDLKNRLPDSW